ncbi:Kazal-type serine protease inhibitor domain-containing protein [Chelativorans xinjiangense]|uniref:Kazal-type serine protease inhibitor domain-containing protein n=1 Tax=Chelativorans xinjiangense TaxID=2681485 RepID=UPI00135AFF86|nr:Kazal-type serine protease inhibitor domain-containing protein [Chelativorans xinjiangense]
MNRFKPLAGLGVIAFAGVILSACTVVVEEGTERPRPPRPQICTQEYAPVCARRGERQRTFPNACFARADGFEPVYRGECRQQSIRPPRPDRPQFCTREYAPVCARRGNRLRTFGNACEAEAADYRILGRGEC